MLLPAWLQIKSTYACQLKKKKERVRLATYACIEIEIYNAQYTWLGDKCYPRLYNLAFQKNVTVQEVLAAGLDSIEFRRTLHDETAMHWGELEEKVNEVELREDQDRMKWSLNSKNTLVVRDLYLFLKAGRMVGYRSIWKLKIPHKINFFAS